VRLEDRPDGLGDELALLIGQVLDGAEELGLELVQRVVLELADFGELLVDRRLELLVDDRAERVSLGVDQLAGHVETLLLGTPLGGEDVPEDRFGAALLGVERLLEQLLAVLDGLALYLERCFDWGSCFCHEFG
jgi:hypothetical protein